MRTKFFILAIFYCLLAQAHVIKGKIYDQHDLAPIPGASIQIKELSEILVSNAEGEFSIEKGSSMVYTLHIKSVGYNEKLISVQLKNDTNLNIGLSPSIQDLDEVVVTGTRTEKKLKEVPVLTQLVHPAHLQEIGLTNVSSALEHDVPGLNLSQFSYRSKLSFQGMNAKYVLFLIDGERIAGEMDGDIDYSRLNLDNVERIEVVRGASSSLYGSNAIGGVVNIITKKQQAAFEYNIHGGYTDLSNLPATIKNKVQNSEVLSNKLNNSNLGGSIGFRKNKLSSRTSFSYNFLDAYKISGEDNSFRFKTQDTAFNSAVNQKFEYDLSKKLNITAQGTFFYNKIFDGGTVPKHHANAGIGGYIKSVYQIDSSANIEISFVSDVYNSYEVYFLNHNKHFKYSSELQQCVRIMGTYKTFLGQMVAGLEYKPEKLYSLRVQDSTKYASEKIAFLQDDYSIGNHWTIVAGARVTQHSQYGINVAPKISAMFQIPHLALRASYGKGFRSPTLKEMYYMLYHNFGGKPFWLLGNSNLKPEKSNYYGFSVELNQARNNFSINLYWNDVKDMISNKWVKPDTGLYINYASATVKGIDMLEKLYINNHLQLNFGLSLVDAQNHETHKRLYGSTPVSINSGVRYNFQIKREIASLEVFGKFVGPRSYEPIEEKTFEDKAMQLWRITFTQQYRNKLFLSLGVDNVFNRTDPNSLGNISPGRNYFISLNYHFVKY